MKNSLFSVLLYLFIFTNFVSGQSFQGFYNFEFDEATGKLLLTVDKLNQDFLMVNAFGTGLGSNDIGIDRGKLNDIRVVRFEKHGDKILLTQPNLGFRANSNNIHEVRAVTEAFAKSVIFGFKIEKKVGENYIIDISGLLYEDLNLVATSLKEAKQGTYKLEKSRCALYFDNIHAFPKNVEFETIMTLTGDATGSYIKSVTPSPEVVSFRQHVSFIELPDNGYTPRKFHPESGYFYTSYYDYATPIHSPIEKKFIVRHRLEKKNPEQKVSEAKEPIIYYIDPGCPEPIKTALMEGGKWWSQAFEAAGFSNAFDVRELPSGAHPLDVRYNMIQWVHRSTRGWSYGSSITDPRTGEILKGHVSLGSLRVRQDFLIAQGLLSPYKDNADNHQQMTKLALDRLKQLSAHEIGHTIGLAHNFAASTNDLSSVMDYPHPYVTLNQDGSMNLTKAYDNKIGIWDKRAIMYGYAVYKNENEEKDGLDKIIHENHNMGLRFLTDEDARSLGSASPVNHLWDNGSDPITELDRLMTLRAVAMSTFGLNTIPSGTPVSELEKIFVPLYFMHRYQVEAVGKLIGGLEYTYAVKGFGKIEPLKPVSEDKQDRALNSLLGLLNEKNLAIPEQISQWLYPPAYGYARNRESFPTSSSPGFDSQNVYESAVGQIIDILLQPERLNRLANQKKLTPYLKKIYSILAENPNTDIIRQTAQIQYLSRLLALTIAESSSHLLKASITAEVNVYIKNWFSADKESVHEQYMLKLLAMTPEQIKEIKLPVISALPPGAPIGSCGMDY
jgi:Met-zincin/Domain of unknown function (DUF5117)